MAKLALLVLLICLTGCVAATPPPVTPVDAERVHVELASLQQGRTLLVQKCGSSCHATPMPGDHARAEWPEKLDEMSARAGLVPADRALIEQYLVAMSR